MANPNSFPSMRLPSTTLLLACLILLLLCNNNVHVYGFSSPSPQPQQSSAQFNRLQFLQHAIRSGIAVSTSTPLPTNAMDIDFVPASPYFTGTYSDAMEIMLAQRIAIDNISQVIIQGDGDNLEEAGFKIMQLNAQTRMAGKIILDSFQENITTTKTGGGGATATPDNSGGSILLLRFLSCQKKFTSLLDLCDECDNSLQNALQGKSGVRAASQIKCLNVVEETKMGYDDFLADVKTFEMAIATAKL